MHYYFHLHNDIETRDEEGMELSDENAAREYARNMARIMAAESVSHGQLDLAHNIEVTDSAGALQFKITFGEVVRVTGRPAPDLKGI